MAETRKDILAGLKSELTKQQQKLEWLENPKNKVRKSCDCTCFGDNCGCLKCQSSEILVTIQGIEDEIRHLQTKS